MNNIELVDIYDENKNKTSKTKIRNKDVFEKGEYLIGVGAIIINSKKQILISQRSALKKVLPLKWECNGGALLSEEDDFIKGLIREIHEELGIKLSKKEAIHLKTVKKEHEFKEIYLFKKDIKLEDIKFTDGETINAKWVDIDEFIKMFNNGEIVYNVDFNNDDYIRSLELLGL